MTGCDRVLARLKVGPATASELYRLGVITHSRIAELRARGYTIRCDRTTGDGAAAYVYTLLAEPTGTTVDGLPSLVATVPLGGAPVGSANSETGVAFAEPDGQRGPLAPKPHPLQGERSVGSANPTPVQLVLV